MEHFSDEQISAYFLGKMPNEIAGKFELAVAADEELSERVQIIERELIDDYLRGNLSGEDSDCFEKKYLTTETRRHRLNAAKGLWQIAAEEPKTAVAPEISFWQKIFGKGNALRLAFASCAVLLVGGAIAFYLLSLNVNKTDVAEVKEPNQTSKIEPPPVQISDDEVSQNTDNRIERNAPDTSAAANKEIEKLPKTAQKNLSETKTVSTPKNVQQIKPALTMVAKLMPGSLRAEGEQSITIAPNAKTVNLLLSPAGNPNNYQTFRAVVKNADGGTVYTSANLNSLSFKIPTEKLENRTYIVFLEGKNAGREFESIAEYTFRVRR